MKNIFIMLLGFFLFCQSVFAQEYEFRSQDRPTFEKSITMHELLELKKSENISLFDVRLLEDFKADPILIPDATYKNPDQIANWSESLDKNSKTVVYCVHGAWVSQKAANYLNEQGIDVYILESGLDAWKNLNK